MRKGQKDFWSSRKRAVPPKCAKKRAPQPAKKLQRIARPVVPCTPVNPWKVPVCIWKVLALKYAHDSADARALKATCWATWRAIPMDALMLRYRALPQNAARYGNMELFKALYGSDGDIDSSEADSEKEDGEESSECMTDIRLVRSVLFAADDGHLAFLQWLYAHYKGARAFMRSDYDGVNTALAHGRLACAEWLDSVVDGEETCFSEEYSDMPGCALRCSDPKVAQWASKHPDFGMSSQYLEDAAIGGHLDIVCKILRCDHVRDDEFMVAMCALVRNGHMWIIDYFDDLCNDREPSTSDVKDFMQAAYDSERVHLTTWALAKATTLYGYADPNLRADEMPSDMLIGVCKRNNVALFDFIAKWHGMTWSSHRALFNQAAKKCFSDHYFKTLDHLLQLPGATIFAELIGHATLPLTIQDKDKDAIRWLRNRGILLNPHLLQHAHSITMFKLIAGPHMERSDVVHELAQLTTRLITYVYRWKSATQLTDMAHMRWWLHQHYPAPLDGVDWDMYKTPALAAKQKSQDMCKM